LLRILSLASRAGLGVSAALLALAVARWGPVHAEAPLDVRALPLAPWVVGFAIVAALCGRERPPAPWRPAAGLLLLAVAGLLLVTATRGPAGLPAGLEEEGEVVGRRGPAAVDVIGRDLRGLAARRSRVEWAGELRVPVSGLYGFWIEGRGRASLALGRWPALSASGHPFAAQAALTVARGSLPIRAVLEPMGPGPRLSLGWTRPDGRSEVIPPRYLGPPLPGWRWRLTDALALLTGLLAGLVVFLAPWEAPRRLPLPRPARPAELAIAGAGYALLVAIMSWPLARDLVHTSAVYRPDGRLNAWILAWAGHAIWREPLRLFQAPAFHPLPDSLAFSENMVLPAALAAPFVAGGGALLGYNAVFLASLVLSGLAAYLLVRRVTNDPLAAFAGGAFFAAGPHRWTRLTHVQTQVTVFLPLALLAIDRFWQRRTLRRALLVGLLLALQGLSSVYLGAIAAAAVSTSIAVAWLGGLRPRELARLAAGFLLAAAMLWPVARPYFRVREFQGREFTLADVSGAASTLASYAAAGTKLWGPLSQRHLRSEAVSEALFPGLAVLVLGLAGLAVAPRRYRAVALAASAAAIVFSLGPETAVYRWAHEHVVLVRAVRVLSRFSIVPALALSVLAGLALSGRRRPAVLLALGAMMAESSNLPLRVERYEGPSPAARWLAGRPGAVVHLPLSGDSTWHMLDGLAHLRPLVNGNSAFMPRPFDRALEMLGGPEIDEEGLRFLRGVGVRHVVAAHAAGLPVVADFGKERVFEVAAGPAAAAVEPGQPVATRWSERGALLDLGELRPVGGIVFELGDGPWPSRPRVQASADGRAWDDVPAVASLADAAASLYRDPRHGRGCLRFGRREARFLRVGREVPLRPGILELVP
jgi:hypothetical protein